MNYCVRKFNIYRSWQARLLTLLILIMTSYFVAPQAPSARAATVTVGPTLPLLQAAGTLACGEPCTLTDRDGSVGPSYRSPITGTIVRWRIVGDRSASAAYRLRVLAQGGGEGGLNLFAGAGSTETVAPNNNGLSTFPASLPIRKGQLIGIDLLSESSDLVWEEALGKPTLLWAPPLSDGESRNAAVGEGLVLAFDADVQPLPTLTSLSREWGSIEGGFSVTLEGNDFSGATAVLFGEVPATFTVNSDFEITATVPPSSTPGKVGITVKTAAGTTPLAKQFAYVACTVPKLKGRRLKSAKGRLRREHCRPGSVKKLPGATARTGRVVKQRPKPGSILPPGAAVSITLKKHSS